MKEFKIGDRVITKESHCWTDCPIGSIGTIKKVEGDSVAIYFDDNIKGWHDKELGIPEGHGLWFKTEELKLVKDNKKRKTSISEKYNLYVNKACKEIDSLLLDLKDYSTGVKFKRYYSDIEDHLHEFYKFEITIYLTPTLIYDKFNCDFTIIDDEISDYEISSCN